MSGGRRLMELEQRVVSRSISALLQEQGEIMDMLSDSESLSTDGEDYMDDLQVQVDAMIIALCCVESEDTTAGERIRDLDAWGDDDVYKLFRFRKAEV